LSGMIKEIGVEYLVKKSWLFGINVVNKKPCFSDRIEHEGWFHH
jgi:outer membrane protein W